MKPLSSLTALGLALGLSFGAAQAADAPAPINLKTAVDRCRF
jgi:Skp family chaperone for outer membrane proteins